MRGSILLIISLGLFCTQDRMGDEKEVGYKQVIKDFKMIETKLGKRSWQLMAASAYVYEHKIKVNDLTLLFFNGDGATTATIVAPKGFVYSKTHDMVATGGVEAVTNDSSFLKAESLFFQNDSTLIKTDSKVTITRADGTELTGKGLVTTPNLTKIEIGGEIKGTTPLEPER